MGARVESVLNVPVQSEYLNEIFEDYIAGWTVYLAATDAAVDWAEGDRGIAG